MSNVRPLPAETPYFSEATSEIRQARRAALGVYLVVIIGFAAILKRWESTVYSTKIRFCPTNNNCISDWQMLPGYQNKKETSLANLHALQLFGIFADRGSQAKRAWDPTETAKSFQHL